MENSGSHYVTCSCIKEITIDENGKAIVIPDFGKLSKPDFSTTPLEGCFCPRTSEELLKCLKGCLDKAFDKEQKNSKIKSIFILDEMGKELPFG